MFVYIVHVYGYVWMSVCVCVCVTTIFLSNRFLTSCLLALASAVPERHRQLGGSQTLRRRERGDTHSHTPQRKQDSHIHQYAHIPAFTHTFPFPPPQKNSKEAELAGLTYMCSVGDDQSFVPVRQA